MELSPPEPIIKPMSVPIQDDLIQEKCSFVPENSEREENKKSIISDIAQGFTSKGYSDFSSSTKAIVLSCLAIVLYLLLGTIVFATWTDGWTSVDALYYTVVTFTTVGYGDLSPVTPYQRLFGIFFAIIGIVVLGNVALGIVFDHLIKSFQEATMKSEEISQRRLMRKVRPKKVMRSFKLTMKKSIDTIHSFGKGNKQNALPQSPATPQKSLEKSLQEDERKRFVSTLATNLFFVAVGIIAPAFVIGYIEEWAVVDIIYFASITATTIGYGDLSPQKFSTRIIAVFYLPLCITIMAKIFGNITASFMAKRADEAEKEFYNRVLTADDLKAMGIERDGAVSFGKFLEFMLVTMNKVGSKDIKELRDLYNALDTDADGSLTFNDLTKRAFGEDIHHIISKSKSNIYVDEEEGDIVPTSEKVLFADGNVQEVDTRLNQVSEEIDN
eukprot:932156_1